jgi:hypothetical protein
MDGDVSLCSQTLDERYLDFLQKTSPVFAAFPQIEPLRYFIFRELLVQQRTRTWTEISKHWLRPIAQRPGKLRKPRKADLILMIEGLREVIVDAILPVYRELASLGASVELVGAGGAANLPPEAHYFQCPSYLFPPEWARTAWDALCDCFHQLQSRPLQRAFNDFSTDIHALVEGFHRLLDDANPRMVLVASMQLFSGSSLVVASRQHGISTVLLQHGILQPLYLPLVADQMITWGESSTETLTGLGVSRERLIALGSPRHDLMSPSGDGSAKRALLKTLSLPDKPTFVFFSNGNDLLRNGTAPQECASWLEGMASQFSTKINVVVRLHPNEDGLLYQNCPHVRVTKDVPSLNVTLDGCDWLGSLCSTVLYDALLFNKPVWQFHANGWADLAENWKQGLARRIASADELRTETQNILSHNGIACADPQLATRVFANHRRAGRAIADFIQERLQSQR